MKTFSCKSVQGFLIAVLIVAVSHSVGAQGEAASRIAPDDTVEITVLGEPELSKVVTVPADGRISYPYLKQLVLAGATPVEVQAAVRSGLRNQLTDPQITVTITQRHANAISILGAVKTPGKHACKDGWHILDALADAGGLSVERPEWASATLIRGGSQVIPVDLTRLLTAADPAQNLLLQTDDVLLVQALDPERTHVQVLGEVLHPGPVPVPPDGSFATVLTEAGGPTAKAALSSAAILRRGVTLPVDLHTLLTAGQVSATLTVEPGDTLVIPQNKNWFAVLGAVQKSGAQDYPDDQPVTILTALSLAGGQATDADLKSARVIHPVPGASATITPVDLEAILKKGDLSANAALKAGDVLFIPSKNASHGLKLGDVLTFASLLRVIRY